MAKILIGRKLSSATDSVTVVQGSAGSAAWPVKDLNRLVPVAYDYIELTYAAAPNQDDITGVVYKTGGAGGTTVATLAITYNANRNISTVTRT